MSNPTTGAERLTVPTAAYALAVVAMFIWGSPPTVSRAVSGDIPPVALSFSRWLIAFLVLLPFVWKEMLRERAALIAHWRPLFLLSLAMTAGSSLSVVAVYFTTATNAVLVNASQPAITALAAWLIARERLSRRQSAGITCAFFGIIAMICRADLNVLISLDINVGDLIMLLAVVGWSLYAVLLHGRRDLPSAPVLLFLISAVGTAALLPMYLVEAAVVGAFSPTRGTISAMIYLALFPTLLATACWNLAIRSIGANRAAVFINLIPVFGAVFAMIFLGERLFVYHVIGAAFVFVGIYFAARRR